MILSRTVVEDGDESVVVYSANTNDLEAILEAILSQGEHHDH